MSRARKAKVEAEQVRGLKHLRQIRALLQRLHGDATARDRAGNRTLFYDQYAALVLLSMFSPAIDSLRAIGQASALPKVRKLLGCNRATVPAWAASPRRRGCSTRTCSWG